MSHAIQPRGLREPEAAHYLGVKPRQLRMWRERAPDDPGEKGPPFIRLGHRTVIYDVRALDEFLEQKRAATAGALRA